MDRIRNSIDRITASRRAMIISGTVCAVPFVFESLYFLSWIMYIPLAYMFLSGTDGIRKQAFRVLLFGLAYYITGYFWITELYPMEFIGFNKIQSVAVIVFALIAIPVIHSSMMLLSYAVCKKAGERAGRFLKLLLFPCVIVFTEYLQTLGPLAFPWCRVAVAQAGNLAIIQSASLFGSYFVAYIVLLANALLAYAIINRAFSKRLIAAAVAVFAVNLALGFCRIAFTEKQYESAEKFTAVALQGNISSGEKWSGSSQDMVDIYMKLAGSAVASTKADGQSENTVMLVPETAFPFTLREGGKTWARVSDFARENNVNFAVGAFSEQEYDSGNSVFMFTPDGKAVEPYSKRHLVPFGEYLPYREIFEVIMPPLAQMNALSSDLYEADTAAVFDLGFAKAGTLICYESIFPELCRSSVNDGAEIMLISTNDSWFGSSGALRHHLANAKLRAVENNVPVIRAANTGISALIKPNGKVIQRLGVNSRGFIADELPMADSRTLYRVIGNVWSIICLLILIFSYFTRKRK